MSDAAQRARRASDLELARRLAARYPRSARALVARHADGRLVAAIEVPTTKPDPRSE